MRRLAVATFAVALVVPATAGDADKLFNGKDLAHTWSTGRFIRRRPLRHR